MPAAASASSFSFWETSLAVASGSELGRSVLLEQAVSEQASATVATAAVRMRMVPLEHGDGPASLRWLRRSSRGVADLLLSVICEAGSAEGPATNRQGQAY